MLENRNRGNVSSKEKDKEESSRESEAREICKFCHMVHIAIDFVSYSLSGILLKRANNINPTGIYP